MTMNATTTTPAVETHQPQVIDEQLHCALTGVPVRAADAYWAPPLVTVRELVSAIVHTLVHHPVLIGSLLMDEQPNVPYAPEARAELAKRRSAEQAKLLFALLVLVAAIGAPIVWLALH